ncbi:MAG: DUF4988 domain-containing protein [Tannerella sp.]|nr:DUF4988 domain-containing protein [Tannerella sp.]
MRAKENLGKTVICSVILACAVTIGFSGCSEDYTPAIERLNNRVDSTNNRVDATNKTLTELYTTVGQLKSKINDMVSIDRVESITDGYKIVLTNEEEYEITNGVDGTPGSVWAIDQSGFWTLNGVNMGYKAIGQNGQNGRDGADAQPPGIDLTDTTWYVKTWDPVNNKYDSTNTHVKATGTETYITYVTENSGNYTLHVKIKDTSSWADIPLFNNSGTSSSAVLELLGYVQGGVINPAVDLSLNAVIDTNTLVINYWHMPSTFSTWDHEKYVRAGQILTVPDFKQNALVVSASMGLSVQDSVKLKNSKGGDIPIAFGTPVVFTGYLTRSAGPSANTIYYIPIDSIRGTYTSGTDFTGKFTSDALYYLSTKNGAKSNFGKWTIKPVTTAVTQRLAVAKVDGNEKDANGTYTITPNITADKGVTLGADSADIYDYYLSYPGLPSAVPVGTNGKTFKVPAAVSPPDTVLYVHKLYVDGIVQTDTIKFKTQ